MGDSDPTSGDHGAPEAVWRSRHSDPEEIEIDLEAGISHGRSSHRTGIEEASDVRRSAAPDKRERPPSRRRSPEPSSRSAPRRFSETNERSRGNDGGAFSGRSIGRERAEHLRSSDGRTTSQDRRGRSDSEYRSHSRWEEGDGRHRGRDDPPLPHLPARHDHRSRDRGLRGREESHRSEGQPSHRHWDGRISRGDEESEFKRPRREEFEKGEGGREWGGGEKRSRGGIVPWMDEPQVEKRGGGNGAFGGVGGRERWGHDMFETLNRSPEKVEEDPTAKIEALLAS